MNKTNIKCPRCHLNQLYKFGLDKQTNQNINLRSASVNLHLTPSEINLNHSILDTLNTTKQHIFIMNIHTIIVTNGVMKNVIML